MMAGSSRRFSRRAVIQIEMRGLLEPCALRVRTISATLATTRSNAGMPRTLRYVSGVLESSETRSSSSPLSISSTWRRRVSSAALVLNTLYTPRCARWAIIADRSRLSSGSPMPWSTARFRSGSCATSALNSSSESCRADSCGENVSGQVAHLLLQRLATSKYASTGDGSGVWLAASRTMSSRDDAPVGDVLAPRIGGAEGAWGDGTPGSEVLVAAVREAEGAWGDDAPVGEVLVPATRVAEGACGGDSRDVGLRGRH